MRIGVVVPVRDWTPFLAEALDAILAQQPAPDAVIVVDDGSREPTALHADHAARCTLLRHAEPSGVAAARATGEAALEPDVELVASCDADDAWAAGKLATQLAALAAHPGAAMCFGAAEIVGGDGRPTGERWDAVPEGAHPAADLLPGFYVRNPVPVSSAVVRREALHDAGGYGGRFGQHAEDWDLWLRLLRGGATFVSVPAARIRYRRHAGAMTADVAALAAAQLALHQEHGDLVDAATRRRALAADRRALWRDRARGVARRLV